MPLPEPPAQEVHLLVDTRHLRSRLSFLLRQNIAVTILDRTHPRGFLIPCPLPKWPTTPELRKARTRTLRRIHAIFAQLLRNHAR